jgi:uncharacterized protein GlcG (DUF336 family)
LSCYSEFDTFQTLYIDFVEQKLSIGSFQMKKRLFVFLLASLLLALVTAPTVASPALQSNGCDALPDHNAVREALIAAQATANGGFSLQMWATLVDRDGIVCVVAFTGEERGDQWPGSRVISAQKANTANAFSLPGLALSTANLFAATQPGASLFGLQESNPVNTEVAYGGNPERYGQQNDPMVGERIGGVNVFGGGLALYDEEGTLLGGIGVSGDSSCADHNIAWRTRDLLGLDYVPGGVSPTGDDNIVYDFARDELGTWGSPSGWGHPQCAAEATEIATTLPEEHPIGGDMG